MEHEIHIALNKKFPGRSFDDGVDGEIQLTESYKTLSECMDKDSSRKPF